MASVTAALEGKSSTERNKIIAAAVLGLVALVALYLAFFSGSSTPTTTRVAVTASPTPRPANPAAPRGDLVMPTAEERAFGYETTPVVYDPRHIFAPDPGRNIFAFYEPPPPTPWVPPPPTPEIIKPATPAPTPPMYIVAANPQSIFAGSRGFRLEVNGERFAPDSRLYFNQVEMPTTFINEQKLITDIPANMIASAGPGFVLAQTPDGKLFSNQFTINIEPPPKPGMTYIGMIGRKRYNNDTAYFTESGKPAPFSARLNDVLSGRFRLVDISPSEVVFEDINLGFRHPLPISKTPPPNLGGGPPTRGNDGGVVFDPGGATRGNPPGIPGTIQPYVPPAQQRKEEMEKKAAADSDDDK